VTPPPVTPPGGPWRTGVIWGVLGLLLLIGTVAAAFFVYGLLGLWSTHAYLLDGAILVGGGATAVFVLLLIAGILYRIDRFRGAVHRRVELFE
jgi:hypothetical protein